MRFLFLLAFVVGCGDASDVCDAGGCEDDLPSGELVNFAEDCDSIGVGSSADVDGVAHSVGWVYAVTTESDVDRVQMLLADPVPRIWVPGAVEGVARDYVESHELARVGEGGELQKWQIHLAEVGRSVDQLSDVSTLFACEDDLNGVMIRVNSYAVDGAMFDCAISGDGAAAYWASLDSSDCWCLDGPTGCGIGGSHDPGVNRLPSHAPSPVGALPF